MEAAVDVRSGPGQSLGGRQLCSSRAPTHVDALPPDPAAGEPDNWAEGVCCLVVGAGLFGFPVRNASLDAKQQVLLVGFSCSLDVTQGTHSYRFGAGPRATTAVTNIKGTGGLTLRVVTRKVGVVGTPATAQMPALDNKRGPFAS